MRTLYFQVQLIKVHCTVNTKNTLKCALKKEQLLAKRQKDLHVKKKYDDPEKKRQAVKRECRKRKCQENPGIQRQHKKRRYQENPESYRKYRKERHLNYQEKKNITRLRISFNV